MDFVVESDGESSLLVIIVTPVFLGAIILTLVKSNKIQAKQRENN